MFLPVLLILIGIFWLLKNLGFFPPEAGDYFWPLVLIALGISMLIKRRKWWDFYCGPWIRKEKKKDD